MWTKQKALGSPSFEGVRELVVIESVWPLIVDALYAQGLGIFRIPLGAEEETPTYAVAFPSLERKSEH